MYADDTIISHSSKYLSILDEDLNSDLVKFQNWLHGNMLSLNATKTQSLIIVSRPNNLRLDFAFFPHFARTSQFEKQQYS